MTPLQAQDAIKADPNFAKAKEQYNAPVATTTPVSTTPVAPTPTAPQVNQEKTTVTTPE